MKGVIEFAEAAKELNLSKFKDMFGDLGEFKYLEGEVKENALTAKWEELTGKKHGAKKAPEKIEGV